MPTVYVVAVVPVGKKNAVETAVKKYAKSANLTGVDTVAVPVVPLAGPDTAPATHLGFCWPVDLTDQMVADMPALKTAQAGVQYQVVPFRTFDHATHWVGWLAGLGLKPQRQAVV
jgi:hypothetical protein